MSPKQTVLAWVEAFNRTDVQALGKLYHDEAINHQVVNEPVVGKEAIIAMFENEFARQKWYV
jgi:ketosteroid isomerase-like protein